MRFRPCIDIHNGRVKQIVGSSLKDDKDEAHSNFESDKDAAFYARLYREDGLTGGHVILLNPMFSPWYEATKAAALGALAAAPGTLQAGGGINPDNAGEFLDAGASGVIVTSYVFSGGVIHRERLEKLRSAVGRDKLILDLSCRRCGDEYRVVTDRWQKVSSEVLDGKLLSELSAYCCEFLVHAADVEGKQNGPEEGVVKLLGEWGELPATYAGGIRNLEDVARIGEWGNGHVDVTIGSALDLFGGPLSYQEVNEYFRSDK